MDACLKTEGGRRAMLREAQSLYAAGQYKATQALALNLLKHSSETSEAMYLLGHTYERTKNAKESLRWFTKAAAITIPVAEDLRAVALDYVLLDDYPSAIHWLEQAVSFDSSNAEAWYDLGRAQMMQGRSTDAEKSLKTSLRLQSRSVRAENNLGVTYEAENRISDAIQAYRLAIEWQTGDDPQNAQPFLNLGSLLVTQQKGSEAVQLLKKALTLDPRNVKAHEQLAKALTQASDLNDAVLEMQSAVELDAGNARLHFELGQLYRHAGRSEDALRELQLSRKLYGTSSFNPDK